MVADFRREDDATPLILMGYFNPILAYGPARFAADARAAGLDGTIVVDLPPEEADELVPDLSAHGLHLIRLATPTTDAARLPKVLDGASGFLYYVAVAGCHRCQCRHRHRCRRRRGAAEAIDRPADRRGFRRAHA